MGSRRSVRLALAIVGTALLAGCKENGAGPSAPCGIGAACKGALSALTLTPKYDTLLVGDSAQIVFAATNSSGAPVTGVTPTYASSNTHVATVDTTGRVRTIAAGATTLTVAAGGLKATASLTVLSIAVLQIQSGADYSCMLITLGRGYCWGLDNLGQLASQVSPVCFDSGTGTPDLPCALTPAAMTGGYRFTTVTTGALVACATDINGAAFCWGDNTRGEIGNNTISSSATPVAVSGGLTFTSISAGGLHVCGIVTGNVAYCWGSDSLGQLGYPGINHSTTPIPVGSPAGAGPFTRISAGLNHTCAIGAGGAAYCWGDNSDGQLGIGTTGGDTAAPLAVAAPGGVAFTAISAGVTHTCGLGSGGTVYCWGTYGGGTHPTPTAVSGTFNTVTSGNGYSCGLRGTAAYCWGNNADGQLGNGTGNIGTASATPVLVAGGLAFVSVTAGYRHACGVLSGGTAACWGSNVFGALGNGLQAAVSGVPVIVAARTGSG